MGTPGVYKRFDLVDVDDAVLGLWFLVSFVEVARFQDLCYEVDWLEEF